jgi:MFS family permease
VVTEQAARATFRDVFAVAEFRALWLAQLLSVAGDQLARVALTVLVYDQTRSAVLAAVTFVASIVPTFIGGVTLAWLADRYPRRRVMIACDLIRCGLVLIMAIHGMPIAAMVVLLFVVTLVGAPFSSARAAVYPDVLEGDKYVVGTAVTLTTFQFAQVVGFAAGGAITGFLGTGTSLVIDAATFAGSALIIGVCVRYRAASADHGDDATPTTRLAAIAGGFRLVLGNPALRIPMLFGWLAAFYDAPEGVVTPLARSLGGGPVTVGFLLAATALGITVGALLFGRLVAPESRLRWMGPLAIANCVILVVFAARPALWGALTILGAAGLCGCFQLSASAAFVRAAPPERRSQAFGFAQGGMNLGQGVVMILAGAAAESLAPAWVIAICGGLGVAAATALAIAWSRNRVQTLDANLPNDYYQPVVRTTPPLRTPSVINCALLVTFRYAYLYDVADSWLMAASLCRLRDNKGGEIGPSALV